MTQGLHNEKDTERANVWRLLAIQTLAGLSQWIDVFLIFSVPAFLWHSTPGQIAFIASCFGLPGLFFGPFVGVLLDRLDSRRTAFIGALIRTGLTGVIAFAPGFEIFATLVFLKGLANICYWPAMSILTNRIVNHSERVRYYSSLSALDQITKIITPLIAGVAIMIVDSQLIFVLSAALALICAVMIVFLPKAEVAPRQLEKKFLIDVWKGLVAGFGSIGVLPPRLISSIGLGIGMSFALAIYDPHLAAFLNSVNFDAATFSLLLSATGLGAVSGALLVRFFFGEASPTRLMQIGIFLFSAAVTGAAILSSAYVEALGVAILVVFWFLNGLGYELFLIGSSVNVQNLCPPNLLGRITTSARSFQMLAVVAGPSIGAWLITFQTRATPFLVSAMVAFILLWVSMIDLKRHWVLQD